MEMVWSFMIVETTHASDVRNIGTVQENVKKTVKILLVCHPKITSIYLCAHINAHAFIQACIYLHFY